MEIPKSEGEVWAIVELMGHVRLAGRLTEEEKFGSKMGRLDIPVASDPSCPNCDGQNPPCPVCKGGSFATQLFGGGSVYRLTIVTEAVARHVCKQTSPAPVSPWDFPKQLPAPLEAAPAHPPCTDCHEWPCVCEDVEDEDETCDRCGFDPCECPQF